MLLLPIAALNFMICFVPLIIMYFDKGKIADPIQSILLVCIFGSVSWFIIILYSLIVQNKLSQAKSDKEALDFWQDHPEYQIIQPSPLGGKWGCEHPTKDSMCFGETLRELMNTLQRMHFETTRWEKEKG